MNSQKMEERARAQEDESGGIRAIEGKGEKNEKREKLEVAIGRFFCLAAIAQAECRAESAGPGERQRDDRGLSTSLNFSLVSGWGQCHFIRTPLSSACTVADLVARNFCFLAFLQLMLLVRWMADGMAQMAGGCPPLSLCLGGRADGFWPRPPSADCRPGLEVMAY
jgi:hypothetical protein